MFIHELRNKYDVKIRTRSREFDIRKPEDRMQVNTLASMADFGTRNRARSSLRSSADNFIQNKQWSSWYRIVPFGYEPEKDDDDEWIRPIEKLESVIEDIFTEFIDTERYTETATIINEKYSDTLEKCEDLEGGSLESRQIKSIVQRPVYRGEPTIPVTDLEHYEPYPSVDDVELQLVDAETSRKAQEIANGISEKYSTDGELTIDPEEYPAEFDPYILESVSSLVRIVCPRCSSDLISDGHQRRLQGGFGSRNYKCTNEDCGLERRWPKQDEYEQMRILSQLNKFDELGLL
jgi:hypothetical protein